MNEERFEIVIKDLKTGKTVCHEKTNTIIGALHKGKGSQCFSLHYGATKPLFDVMLALNKTKEETVGKLAENFADDLLNKLFGGDYE